MIKQESKKKKDEKSYNKINIILLNLPWILKKKVKKKLKLAFNFLKLTQLWNKKKLKKISQLKISIFDKIRNEKNEHKTSENFINLP